MLNQLKHLRLLAIIVAMAGLIFLQFRASFMIRFWHDAWYREWKWDTLTDELNLILSLKSELDESFIPVDRAIASFIDDETGVQGFAEWLKHDAKQYPLVGAGFIWQKGSDSLQVIPLSMKLEDSTRQQIYPYLESNYSPESPKDLLISKFYIDSLGAKLRNSIGFSLYSHDFLHQQHEFLNPRLKKVDAIFGIIWNTELYKKQYLPEILDMYNEDNRFKYGVYWFEAGKNPGKSRGILLQDNNGDTLYSLGRIDTGVKVFPYETGQYNPRPLDRTPGWTLKAQYRTGLAHAQRELISERWDAPEKVIMRLASPLNVAGIQQWIIFALALTALFLMLLNQILARNRQRDFIAQISHELRTPVAKVKLFAETLRHERTVSEARENEYLDTILCESDHLSVLVDNTLNLARLDAGRLKVNPVKTDLAALLTKYVDVQRPILADAGFSVKLDVEDGFTEVKLDPEGLELVLRNLVDNAVKYSTDRKEIEIQVSGHGNSRVRLSVSDRGVGIPPSKRRAVFRRFYRLIPGDREPMAGAGVGLSIVREIVNAHRGRVWCEGREGGGSRILIELPM